MSINDAEALLRYATEFDAIGTHEAEASANNTRGWALHLRGDNSFALEHFHRALEIVELLDDRSGMAAAHGNIGNVYHRTGDNASALECFHRALALYTELGRSSGVARITGDIGSVYLVTGDYPAALEHYHRALSLNEELDNRNGIARDIGNIAIVHYNTGNFSAALEHMRRSLSLDEELGNRIGVASGLGNIGNVYYGTGDYNAAIEHYHRALLLQEELGSQSDIAWLSSCIIGSYLAKGSVDDAQLFQEKLNAMQIDRPDVRISRDTHQAQLLELSGDIQGAVTSIHLTLAEAERHGLRPQAANAHRHLRDLAQELNDFAGYIEHNNEYARITEEINGRETASKLAIHAKQREIDAERKETEKHLAVLHSTLPKHIADRVARGEKVNDQYNNAAVFFLDIVGFTTISDALPSEQVVHLLEHVFATVDAACRNHNIVRIKTIGDSYMAVSFA